MDTPRHFCVPGNLTERATRSARSSFLIFSNLSSECVWIYAEKLHFPRQKRNSDVTSGSILDNVRQRDMYVYLLNIDGKRVGVVFVFVAGV